TGSRTGNIPGVTQTPLKDWILSSPKGNVVGCQQVASIIAGQGHGANLLRVKEAQALADSSTEIVVVPCRTLYEDYFAQQIEAGKTYEQIMSFDEYSRWTVKDNWRRE